MKVKITETVVYIYDADTNNQQEAERLAEDFIINAPNRDDCCIDVYDRTFEVMEEG